MTAGAGAVDRALVVRAIAALLVADHRTRHEAARAFSRAARLFCEVEGGEDWPETAGLTGAAAMPISGPGTSRVMPEAMRGVKRPTGVMDSRGRDSRRDGDQSVHSEGPNGWNRRAL